MYRLSDEEREEIYIQISEMAKEGLSAGDVSEVLGYSEPHVKSLAKSIGVSFNSNAKYPQRILTREELKYFKLERKKNTSLTDISKKLGVNTRFLTALQKYFRIKVECRDCHHKIKGNFRKYCPSCSRIRRSEMVVRCKTNRYKTDPEFLKRDLERLHKNRLKK